MIDETDSDLVADEQKTEFDPEQDIVEYDPEDFDADDLYDVRQEAEELNAVALAARIEIERRNMLAYDGYRVQFGQHELMDIGMMLMGAKQRRNRQGMTDRVERIQSLAESFLAGFDMDGVEFEIEQKDELPTVSEVRDE